MLENLVASYISTLNEDLVMEYASKNGYSLREDEAITITKFLKTYWRDLLRKDKTCFEVLRSSLRKETFDQVIQLYEENKKYI